MSKKPQNSLLRVLGGVLVGANLVTIVLLWVTVLSTYLPPDRFPRLSLLGLAFPVFLTADVVFVFVWLLCRARMVWLPLAGLLAVGAFVLDYCPTARSASSPTTQALCRVPRAATPSGATSIE